MGIKCEKIAFKFSEIWEDSNSSRDKIMLLRDLDNLDREIFINTIAELMNNSIFFFFQDFDKLIPVMSISNSYIEIFFFN